MKSALECIPCFISQALNVARLASADEQLHERVLREVLEHASRADLTQPPVRFGHAIHRFVREWTGKEDPYSSVKHASNRIASSLLPRWQESLRTAKNPRAAAVRLAIAANAIDFGCKGDLTPDQIPSALEDSFAGPLRGNVEELFSAAEKAKDILFLADNAGELVFDRLLLELLPRQKITVVVKGAPAINDALLEDARAAALEGWVALMDTGSDGAGIVLENCRPEFQRRFACADLVIAKGQANFESLDGCEQNIFFLFKVKCPVVARHISQAVGSLVLHRNVPETVNRAAAPLRRGCENSMEPRITTTNERRQL